MNTLREQVGKEARPERSYNVAASAQKRCMVCSETLQVGSKHPTFVEHGPNSIDLRPDVSADAGHGRRAQGVAGRPRHRAPRHEPAGEAGLLAQLAQLRCVCVLALVCTCDSMQVRMFRCSIIFRMSLSFRLPCGACCRPQAVAIHWPTLGPMWPNTAQLRSIRVKIGGIRVQCGPTSADLGHS